MNDVTAINSNESQDTAALAQSLARVLADSYTLYLKTQNYHWNVTGPQFKSLHELFELQYTDLQTAVDEIAERIRTLGHPAPGSYRAFTELTAIEEAGDNTPDATQMVKELAADQVRITNSAKQALEEAQKIGDEASTDLMVQRIQVHEKNAWMLNSSL